MKWPGQGVWVLGAGFLGAALAAACRAAGALVLTFDTEAPADMQADATQRRGLAAGLGRVVPQIAFCCLSTRGGGALAYRRAYVESLQALLSVAPAVRPVLCSSVSLYADTAGMPVNEQTAVQPHNARQEQLLQAEALALRAGGIVARLSPLYGPGRCELLRRHLAGEPRLPGDANRWLNYLHVEDAVQGLMQLAAKGTPGVYNLCSESFTCGAVYNLMQQLTGIPAATEQSPASVRGCADRRIESCLFAMQQPHRFHDFVLAERLHPTLS